MNTQARRTKPLVLVVDDEDVMRLLARESLEQAGFTVEEAANGADAVEAFQDLQPDIVLLDVKMPVLDGFGACARLRETAAGQHTPILVMTGLDDVDSIERAYQAGATDFVNKPINWVILGHRVEYMLRAGRSAQALRESRARLANAQRIAHLGYWEWEIDANVLTCSEEMRRILGDASDEAERSFESFLQRVHEEDKAEVLDHLESVLDHGERREVSYRVVRPDGDERHIQQLAEVDRDEAGLILRVTGTVQDITEQKNAEDKIRFLAYFDGLTGLPNRRAFNERVGLALAAAERREGVAAILFLDLDRFKRINDSLGLTAGDELLQLAADRLVRCVRMTDFVGRPLPGETGPVVARFGGDEFVVLLAEISRIQDAVRVARRLTEVLSEPFNVGGHQVFITTSIGISIFPHDGHEVEAVVKNAESAMHCAKSAGGNKSKYYDESMNAQAFDRLVLESHLGAALERRELVLYYQPQVDVESGAVVGAEALIRWLHPERGLVSPVDFIPLAEESGLIVPIGEWVLRTACAQARRWQESGHDSLRIAVNLSGRQFEQPDFANTIAGILEKAELDPRWLELELTESILMEDGQRTSAALNELKAMGLRLSVDDFGVGYSSLNYLMRFPLDTLKIDRSFLAGIPQDTEHVAITRAILAMARSLGLKVVAEGVETEEQLQYLHEEGCDEFQGFLVCRPVPAEDFGRFLEEARERRASVA